MLSSLCSGVRKIPRCRFPQTALPNYYISKQKRQAWMKSARASPTNQSILNRLYNRDVAPEDSEVTFFLYHKTLALEFLTAIFSACGLVLTLVLEVNKETIGQGDRNKIAGYLLVFNCLGALGIVLTKFSQVRWIKQKKQKLPSLKSQILRLCLEIAFYVPIPASLLQGSLEIITYSSERKQLPYSAFLCYYLVYNRYSYLVSLYIHGELFYGSRPDRLARLYTTQFGTFNSIKYLINEKALAVVLNVFMFNFAVLPFSMLILEGPVNEDLANFHSCLYFVIVTQVTVGYGDVQVMTLYGRLATCLVILAGMTTTALLLILFMKLMELGAGEEESLFLLESLDRKMALTRVSVHRIESEFVYSNMRVRPQEARLRQQQLRAIRYESRRRIMMEKANRVNIRRLMVSNFSEIYSSLELIREKNEIVMKCMEVIRGSIGRDAVPKSAASGANEFNRTARSGSRPRHRQRPVIVKDSNNGQKYGECDGVQVVGFNPDIGNCCEDAQAQTSKQREQSCRDKRGDNKESARMDKFMKSLLELDCSP